MPPKENTQKKATRYNASNTHTDLYEQMKLANKGWGEKMKSIPDDVKRNAGLVDPRVLSINCVFDLYCMAKHQVAFKDIPALENGTLAGHDRDAYFQEFTKFLEDHPISNRNADGKTKTYFPENAKAWGELYRDANKMINAYTLPDINLADPKQFAGIEGELAMLSSIGTDFVQVIDGQMEKYRVPEIANSVIEGFGSEKERMDFQSNITTMQNIKGMLEAMHVPMVSDNHDRSIVHLATARNFISSNQDQYRGKSIKEFQKNFPQALVFNTFHMTSDNKKGMRNFTEEELGAIDAFMDHGEPLPESVTQKLDKGMKEINETFFPGSHETEIRGGFRAILTRNPIQPYVAGLNQGQVSAFELSPAQRQQALEGFALYYDGAIANYSAPTFMPFVGMDMFDLIKVNGVNLKEHTQAMYMTYESEHDVPPWEELSDAQKEEYYKLEAMRATADPVYDVGIHEIRCNAKGEVTLSDDLGYFIKPVDRTVQKEEPQAPKERVELPKPETYSEELLKKSYGGLSKHINSFLSGFDDKKEESEFTDSELFHDLSSSYDDSLYNQAYEEIPIGSVEMIGNEAKVMEINDEELLSELREKTETMANEMVRLRTAKLTGNAAQMEYGNALMKELDFERDLREQTIAQRDTYLEQRRQDLGYIDQEVFRARESLENAQKELAEEQKKLEQARTELEKVADAEVPDEPMVYNPFARPVAKVTNEHAVQMYEKSVAEAQKKVDEARAVHEQATEKRSAFVAETEENLRSHEERIERSRQRYETMEKQIEMDIRSERRDLYTEKAKQFSAAMGPNKLHRWKEGYTDAYMMTKTTLTAASMAYGPVMDVGGSLPYKIAVANRMGFPMYDVAIQTDAAEQTLVNYWQEKEKGKGNLASEREDSYRRKLYDQMSQVNTCLEKVYEKGLDPENNIRTRTLGLVDKGNDAFHLHEYASRGTTMLKASAEAHVAGLQNGWGIDDLGTLSTFNYIRKTSRNKTMMNAATALDSYRTYVEPKYIDGNHKAWLNKLDTCWEDIQKTPLENAEQRKKKLDNMKELIRDGFERKYVPEAYAKSFSGMLMNADQRTIQIEKGAEPAVYQTKGLAMNRDARVELDHIDQMEALDFTAQERKQEKEQKDAERKAEYEKEKEAKRKEEAESVENQLDILEGKLDETFNFENFSVDDDSLVFESQDPEKQEQAENDFINETLFGGKKKEAEEELSDTETSSELSDSREENSIEDSKEEISTGDSWVEIGNEGETLDEINVSVGDSIESKGESMGESMGETTEPETDERLTDMLYKFSTERSSIFMGRESDLHANMRDALGKMQDARIKAGYPMKADQIAEYLESLDEVVCRGRQYAADKENAKTPAGKKRLEAAVELTEYAKLERKRVLKAYNDEKGTSLKLRDLRRKITNEKAGEADAKIVELCEGEMPKTPEVQAKIKELALDVMVGSFANAESEGMRKGFTKMGANVIKNDIAKSKEFNTLMKSYFKNPNMDPETLSMELRDGTAFKKMSKLHKKMEKSTQELQDQKKKEKAAEQKKQVKAM